MEHESFPSMGRRDFVKYTLLTMGALAMPTAQGCGIKRTNVPDLDYSKTLLLKNANLIDVTAGKVTENAWILVEKGMIASFGTGDMEKPPHALVFDLKGRYVTPGLIDAHCHSTASPAYAMRMKDLNRHMNQQKQNYVSTIKSGVTTIRDMGAFPGLLHMFIKDIEKGNLPGPRVVYCNSMLNIKGSHPEINPSDLNIFARPMSVFIGMIMNNFTDDTDMKSCLEENAKGASFIKLTLDDKSVFCKKNNTIPVYSKEQLDAIFRFSEKTGLPVVGHHQHKFGFDRAMQYPFHSIEHIVNDVVLSDADVKTMADRKTAIVPTMTLSQSFMTEKAYDVLPERYRTPEITEELKARKDYFARDAANHCDPVLHQLNLDSETFYKTIGYDRLWENKKFLVNPDIYFNMVTNGFQNLRKMKDAGVLIGCGIDAGMPFNYFGGLYREFEVMSRIGFTNAEILKCATMNGAKILRMEDKIGTLDKGKYADMAVFDRNPLTDITALRSPSLVFKQGELMYSEKNPFMDGTLQASKKKA